MIRKTKHTPPKNWRMTLRNSFARVNSTGGFYALDIEYFVQRRGNSQFDFYRIVWSDRLIATIVGSAGLLQPDWGTIRTGPLAEAIRAAAEILKELRKLRDKRIAVRTAA
jgi:hypothetical protein